MRPTPTLIWPTMYIRADYNTVDITQLHIRGFNVFLNWNILTNLMWLINRSVSYLDCPYSAKQVPQPPIPLWQLPQHLFTHTSGSNGQACRTERCVCVYHVSLWLQPNTLTHSTLADYSADNQFLMKPAQLSALCESQPSALTLNSTQYQMVHCFGTTLSTKAIASKPLTPSSR